MDGDGVEARAAVAVHFGPEVEEGRGDGEEYEGVEAPCLGEMAMEEGVECALTAAAGAIVAREGLEGADGNAARGRVVAVVVDAEKNNNDGSGRSCR